MLIFILQKNHVDGGGGGVHDDDGGGDEHLTRPIKWSCLLSIITDGAKPQTD